MTERKGQITVQTTDVFPIIKKWLYSEHDIFLRELVANATDAITKRSTLSRTRNLEVPEGKIMVEVDEKNKTIKVFDNGVGMTEEEVVKYLAHLAFSGAEEFIKKMEKEGANSKDDIIGKFGLGFYSSFMVASKVEVDSLSMEPGAKAIKWSCEGDIDYTFDESERTEPGTTITLHINEENKEFLQLYKTRQTITKHCDFMPYPIHVVDANKKEEESTPVNDSNPLWKKDPTTLKDEDYKSFYRQLFPLDPEPLFWLHLKVDHPFTLEGILYFPKINPMKPFNESNIKLYSKQVFVSDNVKNIIPEFLSLLKGTIDSSDIPLNVSRSSLQGDPNIKRISNYIVKKVAESLKKLFNSDREKYEKVWEDVGLFVKYGCVSDVKFDEQMRERVVFKNIDKKYVTLGEYRDSLPKEYEEKLKEKILYFEKGISDIALNHQLKDAGIQAVETDQYIDPHFMQHVEMHKVGETALHFVSVDSEIQNILETENVGEGDVKAKEMFEKVLVGEKKDDGPMAMLDVELNKMKNAKTPAYFKTDEQMKRLRNMTKAMGQDSHFPVRKTLVINPNNPLVKNALKLWENGSKKALAEKICHHVQDLATISSEGLNIDDREKFVERTQSLMEELSSLAL